MLEKTNVKFTKTNILFASDGDTAMVMLNGVPISAEGLTIKAEALGSTSLTVEGINPIAPYGKDDIWKYIRETMHMHIPPESNDAGRTENYITERVVNIAELEQLIYGAYYGVAALRTELEKENPSMCRIDELSKQIHLDLLRAKDFEFCVERRKTTSPD